MSDLAAALANWKHAEKNWTNEIVVAAARERLRLSKIPCETCRETPGTVDVEAGFADCLDCGGSGEVWPAVLVEVVAKALLDNWPHAAPVALLDALDLYAKEAK